MHCSIGKESGMSLLSILVSMGLLGMLAVTSAKILSNHFKSNAKSTMQLELNAYKRMIIDKLQCTESIPTMQTKCDPSLLYRLKDIKGNDIFKLENTKSNLYQGTNWWMYAKCNPSGGLVIGAKSKRKDPLRNTVIAKSNIFGAGTKFCEDRFSTAKKTSTKRGMCGGTYNLRAGKNNCCRMVEKKKTPGDGLPIEFGNDSLAVSRCDTTEYVQYGGGRCQADGSVLADQQMNFAASGTEIVMHTNQPLLDKNRLPIGWVADCLGDRTAVAFAVCCPR